MSLSKRFFLLASILLMVALVVTFSPTALSAHAASVSASPHAVKMTTSRTASPLATTCYGGEFVDGPFSLKANTTYELPGGAPWYQTSGRCSDINVNFSQLTASMQMQVCFENIPTPYCNSWKTVSNTGTWYQIATSVLAGTDFRFGIKTTSAVTYKMYVAI